MNDISGPAAMGRRAGYDRRQQGLTIVEVIVAIAILGVVTTAITTTYVNSIRVNSDSGRRTQSAQVLNSIGRRVAGGDAIVLPTADTPLAWDYGELSESFPDMTGRDYGDADLFRVTVENLGTVTVGTAETTHYRLTVCTGSQGGVEERCLTGDTAGPPPGPAGDVPTSLPGIN